MPPEDHPRVVSTTLPTYPSMYTVPRKVGNVKLNLILWALFYSIRLLFLRIIITVETAHSLRALREVKITFIREIVTLIQMVFYGVKLTHKNI